MDTMRRIVGYKYPASIILLHGDAVNPAAGPDTFSPALGWHTLNYFIDSSSNNHPVHRFFGEPPSVVSPIISPSGKFDSCIMFYGGADLGGDYRIWWPHHAAFNFQEYDFTIDFWFKYFTAVSGSSSISITLYYPGIVDNYLRISTNALSIGEPDIFQVQHRNAAGTPLTIVGTTHHTPGVWHHVAFVKAGSLHRLYLNGVVEAEWTCVSSFYSAVNPAPAYPANYHRIHVNAPPTDENGLVPVYLDEFHIQAEARWTEAFTPPTEAYDG